MAEKRGEKEIERQKPNMSEHIVGVKYHGPAMIGDVEFQQRSGV